VVEPGDVVDHDVAVFQCRTCGLGVAGINRDIHPGFDQGFNDRQDAGLFFLGADLIGARGGRFAPHVNNVGTRVVHAQRVVDRLGGIEVLATVGKRIVGDVEDTHDQSAVGWQIGK
jgi:hypothetical protein